MLGIFTAILAIIIEQAVAAGAQIFLNQEIILDYYRNLTWFLALAVVIEEGVKYSAIRFIMFEKFGSQGTKLVISSFLLGLLFGLTEIGVIIFANPEAKNLLSC